MNFQDLRSGSLSACPLPGTGKRNQDRIGHFQQLSFFGCEFHDIYIDVFRLSRCSTQVLQKINLRSKNSLGCVSKEPDASDKPTVLGRGCGQLEVDDQQSL